MPSLIATGLGLMGSFRPQEERIQTMPTKVVTTKVVTIPVDCPDGWEPVAYRVPKVGEYELLPDDRVLVVTESSLPYARRSPVLIVRRAYQWPEFIPPGWWIAMDKDCRWFLFDSEPDEGVSVWKQKGPFYNIGRFIWTPPQVTDWRTSKMQKPVTP